MPLQRLRQGLLLAPILLTDTVGQAAYDMVLGMDVLGRQRNDLFYAGPTLDFPA